MTVQQTIIRFVGDDQASNTAQQITNNTEAIGKSADAVGVKMSALDGIAQGAFQAIGGALTNLASQGFAALSGFFTDSISEASEWNSAIAQTEAVVKSTGGAAGFSAQQMGELASAMSATAGKSIFSDDAILGAENVLATFTQIKGANFSAATASILDVSQALGQDLQSTTIQVGKALNDPIQGITALSRVGVSFSENQKAVIKSLVETGDVAGAQSVILQELSKEFGGSAAAAANTFAGKQAALTEKFNDMKQSIGEKLLPVVGNLMDIFSAKFLPYIEMGIDYLGNFIGSFKTDEISVWATQIQTGMQMLITNFDSIKTTVTGFWEAFQDSDTMLGLQAAFGGLSDGLGALWGSVQNILPSLQSSFQNFATIVGSVIYTVGGAIGPVLALLGEKIGLILEAVAPIGAAIMETLASPAVLNALDQLGQVFGLVGQIIINVLYVYIMQLVDAFNTDLLPAATMVFNGIVSVLNAVLPTIIGILTAVVQFLNGDTTTAMNTLKTTFDTAWTGIKTAVQTGVDYITTAIKTKIDEAKQLGTDLVKGIAKGIDQGVSFIKEAIERVLGDALKTAREWGLIQSPSRKFADMVGAPISQGMAQGIINTSGLVADASSMAVGNAAAVTTYNYNLSASYATVQDEGNIMQDLRAMQILSGAL